MLKRRTLMSASIATSAAAALAACSPSAKKSEGEKGGSGDDAGLTFRIWDKEAKAAYDESLKAFTEETGIKVSVDVVPWDDYWKKLPLDIAAGDGADVFWLNSASFTQFQQAGNLVNITQALGADSQKEWVDAVVELYTRDGSLWGVPQFWDSIALYYNKTLVDAAKVNVDSLAFDPAAETDPLRDAAKKLTKDGVFGFNSEADRQAVIGPFLENNGAVWQDDKDMYAFASEQGVQVFDYLTKLVNEMKVSPSAADTNPNGDFTRDLFIQGKLAMYQSGPYRLKSFAEGIADKFEWAIAPLVKGPKGQKSLVHGVVASGNAKSKKQDEIKQLLEWLGSKEGQLPLGEQGFGFPAHKDAQDSFADYWKGKGVDVEQFITAAEDPGPADTGAKSLAGLAAIMPVFQEIFAGNAKPAEGVKKAQEEGNAAMA